MQLKKKTTAILAGGLLLLGLATASAVAAPAGKTTICHATGSESNPFVRITVSDNSLQAHEDHGDEIPAPEEGCEGDDAPGPQTVVICHRDAPGEPFEKITVPEGEAQGHIDHGDEFPDNETGDCPAVDGPGEEDNDGCSNRNSGLSILQSCNLVLGLNLLNLGQSDQTVVGGDGSGGSNENTGTSVLQLVDTSILINALNLGQSTQAAVTP